MVKIKKLKLGEIPRIALSVSDSETNNSIKDSGADLLEIRVDAFKHLDLDYIRSSLLKRKKIGLPMILTIRKSSEGGKAALSESMRLSLFSELARHVDAVDIELKSSIFGDVAKIARKNKKTLIASIHNFKSTPVQKELEGLLRRAKSLKADIVKIAAKANKKADVLKLMLFTLKHEQENIITISLGKIGSISRVYFPLCGSLVSYAYANRPLAPGQVSIRELLRQLRLYY